MQQKNKNSPLINKRHVLVGSYFYTHISNLLDFDIDDAVFNTKYFFHM